LASGLLAATVAAMREWGGGADMAAMRERAAQHAPLQLLGTHGLFGLAAAGGSGLDALVASGALVCLVTSLALRPPVCELACHALTMLARGGAKLQRAMLRAGAARALLEGASHATGRAAWKLRCLVALHELVRGDDVDVQRELLQAGLLEAALELCLRSEERERSERNERSERRSLADEAGGPASGRRPRRGDGRRVHLLVLRVLGAFTWRSHSASLRHEARPRLRRLSAPRHLLRASALWPGCAALRVGALKVLHEVAPTLILTLTLTLTLILTLTLTLTPTTDPNPATDPNPTPNPSPNPSPHPDPRCCTRWQSSRSSRGAAPPC
jgi:hypothetical protein